MIKKLLSIICLSAGILMTMMVIKEGLPYFLAAKQKEALNREVLAEYTFTELPDTSEDMEQEVTAQEVTALDINFKELQQENPDVIGWIYAPQIGVNYPILRGKTDDYYLSRDYKKNETPLGSIFTWSDADLDDDYIVIFGHNCIGNQMFGGLKEYLDDNFLQQYPTIELYTTTQHKVLRVTDVKIVHYSDPMLQKDYVSHMKEQTIVLSTCYGAKGTENRITLECNVEKTYGFN